MKGNKIFVLALLLGGFMLVAQSCGTAKKGCGCGADINRAYKPKRYH